ncbi:MAG: fructosamine kinase family protein [Chromatiaceae bacterium]|nr:fructosamine kinase family protein [Chromatiaceae bacterium]
MVFAHSQIRAGITENGKTPACAVLRDTRPNAYPVGREWPPAAANPLCPNTRLTSTRAVDLWRDIADQIGRATGRPFQASAPRAQGGGCINQAFALTDGHATWFVKTNDATRLEMFEAEADGLNALADSASIAAPRALCTGTSGRHSFIVLEFLRLGRGDSDGWRTAGRQLAELHRHHNPTFGWHRSNTIGATLQRNEPDPDWTAFWRDRRLGFQLEEAARNGHGGRLQVLGEQLLARFPALIDHNPQASLLHGDLWGGNIGFTDSGAPAIYDPATYFGDREAELAMTELFGGFSADFYAAYREAWPIDPGYRVRKTLYNLYHVLNHLNLFGGGYGGQAERMMQELLAEC